MNEEEKKDYIYLPESLCKKLKTYENKKELMESEVLIYIEKQKIDMSSEIEMLDDDVLMFRAKIAKYKKAMKSAYKEGNEELYNFWESMDGKRKSFDQLTKQSNESLLSLEKDIADKYSSIERLYKKMESVNIYQLEKITDFLQKYDSLSNDTKKILKLFVTKEIS